MWDCPRRLDIWERKTERRLIEDYRKTIDGIPPVLNQENQALIASNAALPDINGHGHVKKRACRNTRRNCRSARIVRQREGCKDRLRGNRSGAASLRTVLCAASSRLQEIFADRFGRVHRAASSETPRPNVAMDLLEGGREIAGAA